MKCISKLQSNFSNMTFADKSRYDILLQQVTHKEGESSTNYINIFQNTQDFSVLVGNSYSEDQLIHIFLNKFHQGGKDTAQISNSYPQKGFKRRGKNYRPKIFIYYIHTD